jgi:two-component system NtrC family sensor kinase
VVLREDRGVVVSLRVLLLVGFVLPAALFGAVAWLDRTTALRQGQLRISKTADALAEHARKVVETGDLVLDRVLERINAVSWAEIAASPAEHAFLLGLARRLPQLESIFLTDPTGHIASSSRTYPMSPFDVHEREYFKAHAQAGERGLYVSAPFRGYARGTFAFTLSRPRLIGPGASFDGLAAVTVSPDYFENFYRGLMDIPSSIITLVRADGTILARYPRSALDPSKLSADNPATNALLQGVDRGTYEDRTGIDGQIDVSAFRRISDTLPLFIIYSVAEPALLANWRKRIVIYAAIAVATSGLLIIVAGLALRQVQRAQAIRDRLAEESEKLRRAESALLQSQKLEALGRLTGGVAHDFNNLLTAVLGNAQLISRSVELGERNRRRLEGIRMAAERGAALTRRLLIFARGQSLNPRTLDLAALSKNLYELLTHSLREDIRCELDMPQSLWPIEADPAQLEFALLNLAVNARDAMPNGGIFRIAGRNRSTVFLADGRALQGDFVEIAVSDNGIGMSGDVRARALEPFFTTKDADKGTGLGLSQLYGFVDQSGGAVELQSELGRGTTVRFWLPRSQQASDSMVDAVEATGVAKVARRGRILVVEDDPSVAETLRDTLEDMGYSTSLATSARLALTALDQDPDFDLVLTDVIMSGDLNGIQLAREIRTRFPQLPIILATGFSDATKEAAAEGFPLVQKPYTSATLSRAIDSLLPVEQAQLD